MAKYTNNKCSKCNKGFRTKQGLIHHKCDSKDNKNEKERCLICGSDVFKKSFHHHYERCQRNDFFKKFGEVLIMLFRIISIFNKNLKVFNYIGDKNDKKIHIFDNYSKKKDEDISRNEKIEMINLKSYIKTINRDVNEKHNENINFYEKFNKKGIPNNLIPLYNETKEDFFPGISFREIVFRFLKDNKLEKNKFIIQRLNSKFKYKDYPTDNEIKESSLEIYEEILRIRGLYEKWKSKFDMFYFILVKFKKDDNSFRCKYCNKVVFVLKKHLRTCEESEKYYKENKDKFIKDYIKKFYNYEKMKIEDYNRIDIQCENCNYNEFINKIPGIMIKYNHYNEKLQKQKEEEEQGIISNDNIFNKNKYISNISKKELLERKQNNYWGKLILNEVKREFDNNDNDNKDNNDNIDNKDNIDNDIKNDNDNTNNDNENNNDNMNNDNDDKNRILIEKTEEDDNDYNEKIKEYQMELENQNNNDDEDSQSDFQYFKKLIEDKDDDEEIDENHVPTNNELKITSEHFYMLDKIKRKPDPIIKFINNNNDVIINNNFNNK